MESQLSSHGAPFNYALIDNHFPKHCEGFLRLSLSHGMSGPSYSRLRVPQIGKGAEITFGHRDFHLIVHFGFNLICVNWAGVAPWKKYF